MSESDPVDSAWIAESDRFAWLAESSIRDRDDVQSWLKQLLELGLPDDLLDDLSQQLRKELKSLDQIDDVFASLVRFAQTSRSPTALLVLFSRDPESLSKLVKVFATSQILTECLIADPESFDLLRVSDGLPAEPKYLVDELSANLSLVEDTARASVIIREFTTREKIRIAFGEFVRGMVPEQAARQLSIVADAVVQASLDFVVRRQLAAHGPIRRIDGTEPSFVVLGLGGLGAEELTYGDNLDLIILCDQIDRKNKRHLEFYQGVASGLLEVLRSNETLFFQVNAIQQPRVHPDDSIVSLSEAINACESSSQIWRRLAFVRARHVAGSEALSQQFFDRLTHWIYRRFLTRSDLAEFLTLRRRVLRRVGSGDSENTPLSEQAQDSLSRHELRDIATDPGSRNDIRLTIRFLQLLHGGEVPEVRTHRTQDALDALEQTGCVTHQEASLLTANYAKLTRLEHQLSIIAGTRQTSLPTSLIKRQRLAWQLGIRDPESGRGDVARFEATLEEMLRVNRRIIGHLIAEPDAGHLTDVSLSQESGDEDDVAVETELLLDPNPDPAVVREVLSRYGFDQERGAGGSHPVMQDLVSLASETSSFLSPRRCRHFFAALVPSLLQEISQTPDPVATLDRLVKVADSIGAKATLWELLRTNRPTLKLMIRLCASSPYLSDVLTGNPGMIDELVDSLVMDRLPSAERLDTQSQMLCRNAADLGPILQSFKDAAHLMTGVHQILGKEDLQCIHDALTNTAESTLRRVIEFEQEKLAVRFGDPWASSSKQGGDESPAELIALAFGRLGGREPNYHSDLDVLFLYTDEGETRRRVGGPRSTTENNHFFNELTKNVVEHVNRATKHGQLYDLDSRLRPTDEEGILSVTVETFARRFRQDIAPLWQRLAICKARPISGSRSQREAVAETMAGILRNTRWRDSMIDDVMKIRMRMERAAGPNNLKRGPGGAIDVELLTQLMTLRYAPDSSDERLAGAQRFTNTLDVMDVLRQAGHINQQDADQLSHNYRVLRTAEANLRLMSYPQRHEFPRDDEPLEILAFLGNSTSKEVTRNVDQARSSNREIFSRLMKKGFS